MHNDFLFNFPVYTTLGKKLTHVDYNLVMSVDMHVYILTLLPLVLFVSNHDKNYQPNFAGMTFVKIKIADSGIQNPPMQKCCYLIKVNFVIENYP
jgi:hypothetical protein